jgi:multidrug resistance efflux pump
MTRTIVMKFVLPLVAIGLLVYAARFVGSQNQAASPAPPVVPPPVSPFDATVAGAGLVEAQTENIAIGSATPGVVTKVFVTVDDKMAAGDKLFELDDRMLQAELRNRKAALAAAQADLTRRENEPRPEQLRMSKARYEQARANVVHAQDQYNRTKELFQKKVETAENLIETQQALRAAQAEEDAAQAEYEMTQNGAWKFDLDVAKAAVAQAEAQVQHTLTELDRLVVRALVAGRVLQVNVRPGEFVGAPPGQALIVLGNIEQMHVRVDIDENDIPRFVPGTPGVAMVRGQPDIEFPLKFVRVEPYVVPKRSLTGENTERVDTRVLQVIYELDPKGHSFYVGQQIDVYLQAPKKDAPVAKQSPPTRPAEAANPSVQHTKAEAS